MKRFDISSSGLHILAMSFMLLDHLWASVAQNQVWMTCVGRLAFPIFAFMIVEGYFHTKDFNRYMTRMLIFALISEIPFDLFYSGIPVYPYHQNVLWTFLIALSGIRAIEFTRRKGKRGLTAAVSVLILLFCFLMGFVAMTDFYGAGVLTVFIFYFFRGRKWWCFLGQLLCLYYLNVEVLGGLCYVVSIFGHQVELVQQGFALLALIPIWLYRGRKGFSNKAFQYFCYAFYPVHCLILGLLAIA